MNTPRIALTPGEPAGIGPDLCIRLAQTRQACEPVVLADPELLRSRAALLGLPIRLYEADPARPAQVPEPGTLAILRQDLAVQPRPGSPDTRNALSLLQALDRAVDGCRRGDFQAMVTGPLQKSVISEAGIDFSGHTEYLAARCDTPLPVMMLVAPGMRVALVTTHLALREVPAAITRERLTAVLRILHRDLRQKFAIAEPRIAVLGLNPHAGESGHLGREEIEVITPVLEGLRAEGLDLRGPLPADTAFTPHRLEHTDAVLAMYHDQGLPVLKYAGFGQGVNITLGLPIIRTSVDHGTALDLAGTGRADAASLQAALDLAVALAARRG